jgi:FAD:protein FMN transferase
MAIGAMPVAPRQMTVQHLMGTVISIDVRDMDVSAAAIDAAFAWLHEVDDRFSTYKPESEVSRLGRGELTLEDCHPHVAEVLAICEELRIKSGGAFNAWRARADGRLDPSGVVKGWAVDRAAAILEQAGATNFCINAGGDVLARGIPAAGRKWRVGIRHPEDPQSVATVLEVSNLAVATSGRYERGDHIIDGRSGEPARGLLSLTVVGPRMTEADAYATAGFAMGKPGIAWVAIQTGYDAYGITQNGRARYTRRLADLVSS